MPKRYVLKKPVERNARGHIMKPKRGPAKGCINEKGRCPTIVACEADTAKWCKEKTERGLYITSTVVWARFRWACFKEGKVEADYYGLRKATWRSWHSKWQAREGFESAPPIQKYECPKSADWIFAGITSYLNASHKFFQSLQVGGTRADDIVLCNLDEVPFTQLVSRRVVVSREQRDLLPTVVVQPWKLTFGVFASSHVGFTVDGPMVAVDRASDADKMRIANFCDQKGFEYRLAPANADLIRRWIQKKLLPKWREYKAGHPRGDKLKLVLLMDNAAIHTAVVKAEQSLGEEGTYALYLAPYSTSVMQPVDWKIGRSGKNACRAVGSASDSPVGILATVAGFWKQQQNKFNGLELFKACGTDPTRSEALPLISDLHSRFRTWYTEMQTFPDPELRWNLDPLPEEEALLELGHNDVEELKAYLDREGIANSALDSQDAFFE